MSTEGLNLAKARMEREEEEKMLGEMMRETYQRLSRERDEKYEERMREWKERMGKEEKGGGKRRAAAQTKDMNKSGLIMMTMKDIYPVFHIVRMIEDRLVACLFPTKFKLGAEDLRTPMCECLWELAVLMRIDQEEATAAVDCDIIPALHKIVSNPTHFFPDGGVECALSVLLELCRYRPCCCILAAREELLRHVCVLLVPASRGGPEELPSSVDLQRLENFQMVQAGLDMLGRLLGGLGEDTALLQSVARILQALVLTDYGLQLYQKLHLVESLRNNNKWCNYDTTIKALQTATQAALQGEPIGPTGWTSHYSMEKYYMPEIGTTQERKENAVPVKRGCSFCQEEGLSLLRCGACKQVFYCTKEHQRS
ncbi:hypothetical protein B484DRAFT_451065, partial [Ochromonadaceae sp. CCMP2298]